MFNLALLRNTINIKITETEYTTKIKPCDVSDRNLSYLSKSIREINGDIQQPLFRCLVSFNGRLINEISLEEKNRSLIRMPDDIYIDQKYIPNSSIILSTNDLMKLSTCDSPKRKLIENAPRINTLKKLPLGTCYLYTHEIIINYRG